MSHLTPLIPHPIPNSNTLPTDFEVICEMSASTILKYFPSMVDRVRKRMNGCENDCGGWTALALRTVNKRLYHCTEILKSSTFHLNTSNVNLPSQFELLRVSPLQHHIQSVCFQYVDPESDQIQIDFILNLTQKNTIKAIHFSEFGSYNLQTEQNDFKTKLKDFQTGRINFMKFIELLYITPSYQFKSMFSRVTHLTLPSCVDRNIKIANIFKDIFLTIHSLTYLSLNNFQILNQIIRDNTDDTLHTMFKSLIMLKCRSTHISLDNLIRLLKTCSSLKFLELTDCPDFGLILSDRRHVLGEPIIPKHSDAEIIALFQNIKCMKIERSIVCYSSDPWNNAMEETSKEKRLRSLLPNTKIFGTYNPNTGDWFDRNVPEIEAVS